MTDVNTYLESLNAPYGARCFLTVASANGHNVGLQCLNAPYGARCFLTGGCEPPQLPRFACVLMHLMALGAF